MWGVSLQSGLVFYERKYRERRVYWTGCLSLRIRTTTQIISISSLHTAYTDACISYHIIPVYITVFLKMYPRVGPRRRWEEYIKMDLQEVGGSCGDWMELAQDRDRWRALVGMVRNLRVPKMRRIS